MILKICRMVSKL